MSDLEKVWDEHLRQQGVPYYSPPSPNFVAGWDAARAADAEQIANLRGYVANLEENRATTELETRELEAENATLTQQIAAVQAAWDASTGWHQFGEDVRAILKSSPTPEPMVSVAAVRKLITECRFDIEAGPALSVVALEQLLDGVVESDHG